MIKLRIDVDYPYPSRAKSFLQVALRRKNNKGNDYLRNARIIAQMINKSPREVMAYWFFTPYTLPDKELLALLDAERHEVAVHVVSKPFEEWQTLQTKTGRQVRYYTIHGTQSKFARLLWGRNLSGPQVVIPKDYPLTSLHIQKTLSIDRERYRQGYEKMVTLVEEWIDKDVVLSFHPEWLFEKNKKTQRGPVYDLLKAVLKSG
jgi:hypothetical protein